MAHFAELNSDNIVVQVVVIGNDNIIDDDGNESEEKGKLYCQYLFGGGTWVQTSYNKNFRKNFAGEGAEWRPDLDGFVLPKEQVAFQSWTLNETTCQWEAPIPHPDGTNEGYDWDEENQQWVQPPPTGDMNAERIEKATPPEEEIEVPEHNYPVEEI